MKKIAILLSALCLAFVAQAQTKTVDITAGTLENALSGDYAFTDLVVSGTMDVRDFACINENAITLTSIDLSGCAIAAYDSRDEQYLGYRTHFDSNAIPPSAFFGFTELERVVLPASITVIGDGAFAGCDKLTIVTGNDAVEVIGDYAFSGCTALEEIALPNTLKRIGDYAFDKCKTLTSVDMSDCDRLAYIGKRAFAQNTSLSTVKLSNGVKTLGEAAFAGCSMLQNVTMPAGVSDCGIGVFAGCSMLSRADISQCTLDTLPAWTFSGCSELGEVLLPESLSAIGEGAFYYCLALPSVNLPLGIEYLDSFAFAGCSALQSIDFMPEGLESIGRYTFYQNISVDSVTIPATTSYIGDHAFDGCVNAATFSTEREMPAELGELVFANMNVEEKTLSVPTESVVIYEATAQWQDFGEINGATAVEEVVADNAFKVMFEQYNLVVTSTQDMTEVRMYDTAGILLARVSPNACRAMIDTRSFVGNIFLLQVTTADGQQAVTKVARIIR